ncbi:MAG TPA: protein kinase [Pseudonocardiaceae bacterium]|jgi:serine/threonine protein kinase|nr:protein kinase [Pseudonocardiaceae bacterium]
MAVTDADRPDDGLIAGRYRLIERLGGGSMGEVWRAHDERLDRTVAVKRLLPGALPGNAIREARITARLRHPNAVTVHDVVEHDGVPCVVMAYVPGHPLTERGPLPPVEAARIGQQVASALAAAHKVGIVHRDVKPDNVLLTDDGTAMITDFGISRMIGEAVRAGPLVGTPAYLAPEVAAGADASFASDVFSLGATLYTAVEGAAPFGYDDDTAALLRAVATGVVPESAHAGPLGPVLMWMLRREPHARPTMAQAAGALAEVGRPAAQPTLPLDTNRPILSGRAIAVALTVVGLVALGLTVGLVLDAGSHPTVVATPPPPAYTRAIPPPPTTTTEVACVADYTLTNSWPGGYQAQVTVTAGDTPLDGWTVTLDLPDGQTINSLWDGSLSHQGASAHVVSLNYNATVSAESSTTFGFLGSYARGRPAVPVVHCVAGG